MNVDTLCKTVNSDFIPNEVRLAIKRENAGLNGRKAWFLLPNAKIEVGKPVTFKRAGDSKNARNLQASYIYHDSLAPEAVEEILSCE